MVKQNYPKYLEVGTKFNYLIVLSLDNEKNKSKKYASEYYYKCSCQKCGGTCSASKYKLTSLSKIDCGCGSAARRSKAYIKTNPIEECDGYIKLFKRNSDIFCKVDEEVYEDIKQFCWNIDGRGYFQRIERDTPRGVKHKHILLHRYIIKATDSDLVDHISGDKLDNRISNLRLCNPQQNSMNRGMQSNNTSGVAGVYFNNKTAKWCAQIKIDRKPYHLGSFSDKEEAIKARKEAEEEYFGEYARKNEAKNGI
jgi:hypothetical protein